MAKFDAVKAIFAQIDTNRDGRVDREEFQKWALNAEGLPSSTYESSVSGVALNDNSITRFDESPYRFGSERAFESTASLNASFEALTAIDEFSDEATILTNSTQHYDPCAGSSNSVLYKDPDPLIVRRTQNVEPLTYQQKVIVRFLQPPPAPSPGPLIIKEVRPSQPPPPPPLIIRQCSKPLPPPKPLILRECPPVPPAATPSQTVVRQLPSIPVPPRSVIVERFPCPPQKPRDIIIERWMPYDHQSKRRTIVQRAPEPAKYPKPRNTIVVYEPIPTRVVRCIQKCPITQADPEAYKARYGATLLSPAALIHQARCAGVVEDISPPKRFSSGYGNTRNNSNNFNLWNVGGLETYGTVGAFGTTTNDNSPNLISSLNSFGESSMANNITTVTDIGLDSNVISSNHD